MSLSTEMQHQWIRLTNGFSVIITISMEISFCLPQKSRKSSANCCICNDNTAVVKCATVCGNCISIFFWLIFHWNTNNDIGSIFPATGRRNEYLFGLFWWGNDLGTQYYIQWNNGYDKRMFINLVCHILCFTVHNKCSPHNVINRIILCKYADAAWLVNHTVILA